MRTSLAIILETDTVTFITNVIFGIIKIQFVLLYHLHSPYSIRYPDE